MTGDLTIESRVNQLPPDGVLQTQVMLQLNFCNVGATTATLSEVEIKYWYSTDGTPSSSQVVDGPYSGADTLTAVKLTPALEGANMVLTVGFTTGSLVPGACVQINAGVHGTEQWIAGYDLTNDWSYIATTAYALNDQITIERDGQRVWGREPPAVP